jgi:hypothetical protein
MAYNLADLEQELLADGWTVSSDPFVRSSSTPGQVNRGGYRVTLTSPQGVGTQGSGDTRSDALRAAADGAGLLDPGQPPLL